MHHAFAIFLWLQQFFFFAPSPPLAGPGSRKDLGASNNGPGITFADCISPTQTSNCANFTTSPFETVNGVPVLKFAINPGDPTLTTIFDVFQLPGTITPGSQVALTFNTSTGNVRRFRLRQFRRSFRCVCSRQPRERFDWPMHRRLDKLPRLVLERDRQRQYRHL